MSGFAEDSRGPRHRRDSQAEVSPAPTGLSATLSPASQCTAYPDVIWLLLGTHGSLASQICLYGPLWHYSAVQLRTHVVTNRYTAGNRILRASTEKDTHLSLRCMTGDCTGWGGGQPGKGRMSFEQGLGDISAVVGIR